MIGTAQNGAISNFDVRFRRTHDQFFHRILQCCPVLFQISAGDNRRLDFQCYVYSYPGWIALLVLGSCDGSAVITRRFGSCVFASFGSFWRLLSLFEFTVRLSVGLHVVCWLLSDTLCVQLAFNLCLFFALVLVLLISLIYLCEFLCMSVLKIDRIQLLWVVISFIELIFMYLFLSLHVVEWFRSIF